MARKPDPPPPKDPFDIAGADDRAADYLDAIENGRAYRAKPEPLPEKK